VGGVVGGVAAEEGALAAENPVVAALLHFLSGVVRAVEDVFLFL